MKQLLALLFLILGIINVHSQQSVILRGTITDPLIEYLDKENKGCKLLIEQNSSLIQTIETTLSFGNNYSIIELTAYITFDTMRMLLNQILPKSIYIENLGLIDTNINKMKVVMAPSFKKAYPYEEEFMDTADFIKIESFVWTLVSQQYKFYAELLTTPKELLASKYPLWISKYPPIGGRKKPLCDSEYPIGVSFCIYCKWI